MESHKDGAGVKHDKDKDKWGLMLWPEVRDILKIVEYGAQKYPDPGNWKRVPNGRVRYFEACMRHLLAWFAGETYDSESGLPHLAHAGCCILFLLWIDSNPPLTDEMTDL